MKSSFEFQKKNSFSPQKFPIIYPPNASISSLGSNKGANVSMRDYGTCILCEYEYETI
jgi:hypothetical protein